MTAKDVIDAGRDGAVAATLSGRDLKDGAVHLNDRALHLKAAANALKSCAAAAKDRGDTPKLHRLIGKLRGDPPEVLGLNAAKATPTISNQG